jgi:hypothetical protein
MAKAPLQPSSIVQGSRLASGKPNCIGIELQATALDVAVSAPLTSHRFDTFCSAKVGLFLKLRRSSQ